MTKPHWQKLHDGWVSDFMFWLEQRWFFIKLLRKHPGNKQYMTIIRSVEVAINDCQKAYKKIYGTRFNVRDIKEETER